MFMSIHTTQSGFRYMHLPNESSKGVSEAEAEASGATRQLSMHDNYSKVIHEDSGYLVCEHQSIGWVG